MDNSWKEATSSSILKEKEEKIWKRKKTFCKKIKREESMDIHKLVVRSKKTMLKCVR